jgi:hypothetical protein
MAGKVRRVGVGVICSLSLLAFLGAAAWAGSGSPYPSDEGTAGPFAPKDCAVPRERPTRLVLRCDGFDSIVNGISWGDWGNRRAKGQGRFEFERRRYPVKIEIHRVRRRLCGDERLPMFTRIKLDFRGRAPDFRRPPRKLSCSLLDSGWSP